MESIQYVLVSVVGLSIGFLSKDRPAAGEEDPTEESSDSDSLTLARASPVNGNPTALGNSNLVISSLVVFRIISVATSSGMARTAFLFLLLFHSFGSPSVGCVVDCLVV
jgi:hypothetical protein